MPTRTIIVPIKLRREPEALHLPPARSSRAAAQTTIVDPSLLQHAPVARCGCGHPITVADRFCGGCGVRLFDVFHHETKGSVR